MHLSLFIRLCNLLEGTPRSPCFNSYVSTYFCYQDMHFMLPEASSLHFLQQISGTTVDTLNMVYLQIRQHIICHELEYETYPVHC